MATTAETPKAIGRLPQFACEHWTHYGVFSELSQSYLELITALKYVSSLWPEPPHCAPVNPEWVGERDGKMRAILLEAALEISRKAISKAEAK